MRGAVNLGRGGTLLIDPTDIEIRARRPHCSSTSGTVYQSTLESELKAGTNMQLIASNGITLDKLGTTSSHGVYTPGSLNGANSGNGGSLLLGIGTATTGIGANDGTYQQGAGGSITFQSPKDSIVTDGGDLGGTPAPVPAPSASATSPPNVGGHRPQRRRRHQRRQSQRAAGLITNAMPAIRLCKAPQPATSPSAQHFRHFGQCECVSGCRKRDRHRRRERHHSRRTGGAQCHGGRRCNIQLEGAVNISGGGGNSDSVGFCTRGRPRPSVAVEAACGRKS